MAANGLLLVVNGTNWLGAVFLMTSNVVAMALQWPPNDRIAVKMRLLLITGL